MIEYILTYNNIRVGGGIQLRMAFAESTLCEFELFPIAVDAVETETLVPTPGYITKQLEALGNISPEEPVCDIRLRYVGSSAEWVAVK